MADVIEVALAVVVLTAAIVIPAWLVASGFDRILDYFIKRP